MKRHTEMKRGEPMKRGKPMERSGQLKRVGKKGRQQKAHKKEALDLYFSKFGWDHDDVRVSFCQICHQVAFRPLTDPCHKVRASHQGGEDPTNIVAGHRLCHQWMDGKGSKGEREQVLRASAANCQDGGFIRWPTHLWESLKHYISQPHINPNC